MDKDAEIAALSAEISALFAKANELVAKRTALGYGTKKQREKLKKAENKRRRAMRYVPFFEMYAGGKTYEEIAAVTPRPKASGYITIATAQSWVFNGAVAIFELFPDHTLFQTAKERIEERYKDWDTIPRHF